MGAFLIKESAHSFHILLQLGGPDGELGAATRYLSQRYTAPWGQIKAGLTDIGTEELAHIELVSAILYQLTKGLSVEEIKEGGMEAYFVDHTTGIYPQAASGVPFSASTLQSTGDIVCDLVEDLAAEQKAPTTISCDWWMIRMSGNQSSFCVQEKLYISSGLARCFELRRSNWIAKTFMHLIRSLT